jgi:hypothetical protein
MEQYSRGEPEDRVTGTVESQTAKIPSIGFLGVAVAAMATSAILKLTGKDDWSLFIGQWVPSILVIGTYNKLVKQRGSDSSSTYQSSSRAA